MADSRVYRPVAVVRLTLRLEDFARGDTDPPTEELPFDAQLTQLSKAETNLQAVLAQARARGSASTVSDAVKQLAKVKVELASLRSREPVARALEEVSSDPFSVPPFLTVPVEVDVELNSWRTADTATMTIPFRDAPLPDQVVRAALVEVFMGTVKSEDFATPDRWRLPLDRQNLVFRGYADKWDTNHSGEDATVTIEARDLTSILMDEKVHPMSPIFRVKGAGEPITQYVNRVLASLPVTRGKGGQGQLKALMYRASQEPVLSRKLLNRALQTAKSRTEAEGPVAQDPALPGGTDPGAIEGAGEPRVATEQPQETTAWDLITTACGLVGLVPTYDPAVLPPPSVFLAGGTVAAAETVGDFLLLRPPQTVFDTVDGGVKIEGGPQDGFSRELPDPNSPVRSLVPSEVRFMVWGRNIKDFNTSRKLGKVKAPAVEVISYNPDAPADQRVMRARFPPSGDKRVTKIGATGQGRVEEVVTRYARVRDKAQLQQTAVALYHALSRPEMEVTIETDDLASYIDPTRPEQHNENPDLLKLRHGTPVRVVVARQVQDPQAGNSLVMTPLSELFERRTGELRRWLLEQNQRYRPALDPELSRAVTEEAVSRITTAIGNRNQVDLFYTRSVQHKWSVEEGWSGTIKLVNYMEVRNDPKALSKTAQDADRAMRLPAGAPTPPADVKARQRARRTQGRQP